jgi:hypothetical protein
VPANSHRLEIRLCSVDSGGVGRRIAACDDEVVDDALDTPKTCVENDYDGPTSDCAVSSLPTTMCLAHFARVDEVNHAECAYAAAQHRVGNRPMLVGSNATIPTRLIGPNESDRYLGIRCRHDGEICAVSLKAWP